VLVFVRIRARVGDRVKFMASVRVSCRKRIGLWLGLGLWLSLGLV
jgi:hypothetical protein